MLKQWEAELDSLTPQHFPQGCGVFCVKGGVFRSGVSLLKAIVAVDRWMVTHASKQQDRNSN